MAVRWQEVPLPFGQGIDTKTDPKLTKGLVDLENGVFTNAPAIRKRNGYDELEHVDSTGAVISNAVALATRGDELLLFDDEYCYSYDERVGNWRNKGRCTGMKLKESVVAATLSNQTDADVATNNNMQVIAWTDSSDGYVHYTVSDLGTGAVLVNNTSISGATKPRLVATGGLIHLYYYDSVATSLYVLAFPTASPANPYATRQVVSNVKSGGVYDACAEYGTKAEAAIIIYLDTSNQIVLIKTDKVGAAYNTLITDTNVAYTLADAVSVSPGAATTWFTYLDSSLSACTVAKVNANFISTSTVTRYRKDGGDIKTTSKRITIQIDIDNEEQAHLFVDNVPGGDEWLDHTSYFLVTTSVPSATHTFYHHGLASHAFWFRGHAYVNLYYDSLTSTTYLCASEDETFVARCAIGIAAGQPTGTHMPRVGGVNNSESRFVWGASYRTRLETAETAANDTKNEFYAQKGVKAITYDFAATDRYRFVEVGGNTYTSGGILWAFDGVKPVEQGFLIYPEGHQITDSSVNSTGSMATGDYTYRFYFEDYYGNGDRTKSTSVLFNTSVTNNVNRFSFLPTLAATMRANTSIVGYRTAVNPDVVGGAPFYRVTSANPAATGFNRFLANNVDATNVTLDDGMSDGSLTDNELDYQNTGELDNTAPEAASIMLHGNGRVWLADVASDPNKILYSKLRYPGQALEFSDSLVLQAPEDGGAITGLGTLNGMLVIFKLDRIYVVTGEGPNNLGVGYLSQPQLVSNDVGCNNHLTVVNAPQGLLFSSDKGIYMLDGELRSIYVGAPVEKYNDADIRAAILINDSNEIRFITASGRTLVYNYQVQQWSTFTGTNAISAVIWKQKLTYLKSSRGDVFVENPDRFTDAGGSYKLRFKTPWYSSGGPQSYQRIRALNVLGTYHSSHTLRTRIRYDFQGNSETGEFPSSYVNTSTYGDGAYGDDTYGGTGDSSYQFRVMLPRQKCQAVQFEIEDVDSYGRAFEISNLTLEAGYKRGPVKRALTRKVNAS